MDEEIIGYMKECRDIMKQTLDRVDALEDVLYNQILNPAKELNDEWEKGKRKEAFIGKYGEQLGAFNDKLKAIEGDDFDLVENTFNDYDSSDKSIEESEYVAALISKVQAQLDKISQAFGGGNVEIKAKDEDGDGVTEEVEVQGTGDKSTSEDNAEVEVHNEEEESENIDSPEEIEALKKELMAIKEDIE